jgi:hypothetical protein
MSARLVCDWVKKAASDWQYEVAAIGYPGPVVHGRPVHEPYNMNEGWVGFDYAKGLDCPVKGINDAAMQAIGSYRNSLTGAIVAVMTWVGLSSLLGSCFRYFENLDKTHGPLGAFIGLYVWFYLSGFAILLGEKSIFSLGRIERPPNSATIDPSAYSDQ